jgi:arginyl-tRNA--protein-N-Asp/Glu arginylyltransferase
MHEAKKWNFYSQFYQILKKINKIFRKKIVSCSLHLVQQWSIRIIILGLSKMMKRRYGNTDTRVRYSLSKIRSCLIAKGTFTNYTCSEKSKKIVQKFMERVMIKIVIGIRVSRLGWSIQKICGSMIYAMKYKREREKFFKSLWI